MGNKKNLNFSNRKCGECAKFRKRDSECPSYDSFFEYVDGKPLMDGKSAACSSFVEGRKARKIDRTEDKCIIEVAALLTEDFIAEEVYNPSEKPRPQFAVYHFGTGKFKVVDSLDLGETDPKGRKIIYNPVFNDHVKKGMVILPRKPEPCSIPEVTRGAIEFVFSGYDPCDKDNALKLETLIAITSWILDKEKPRLPIAGIGVFAVILPIRGPSGTGKNRLANLLRFLTYHPFFDVSTHRIPSLYRPLDIWKGTLVLDEADLRSTGETSELIHFLNSRATGTPIGRQNPGEGQPM